MPGRFSPTYLDNPTLEAIQMPLYNIALEGDTLKIGFGEPAQNTEIVPFVHETMDRLVKSGAFNGVTMLKIDGPASLPVAMTIAHAVAHIVQAVGCFDPKLNGFVVVIAHGPTYHVGQLIPA